MSVGCDPVHEHAIMNKTFGIGAQNKYLDFMSGPNQEFCEAIKVIPESATVRKIGAIFRRQKGDTHGLMAELNSLRLSPHFAKWSLIEETSIRSTGLEP
jgi:hypothetical protein